MKPIRVVLVLLCAGLLVLGTTESKAQKKSKKEPVIWPADKIAWMEAKGGPPGLMFATLWGHMDKGAYGAFVKFPAGIKNPLHTHTHDIKAVVVSGVFLYAPEGGTEQRLGPGSYLFIPGGVRHVSGTPDDSPCELFQDSPGKFDMTPVGDKK